MVLVHTPVNPLLKKFFENYPKYHIAKFLIDHRLYRLTSLLLLKALYWIKFKIIYRLELKDTKNLIIKKKDYSGEPILIVQNHSANRDGQLSMATWAHFGKLIGVLSTF